MAIKARPTRKGTKKAKAEKKSVRKTGRPTPRATGDKNTGLISVAFRIKPGFHRKITKAAAKADQTLNDWCISAAEAYMPQDADNGNGAPTEGEQVAEAEQAAE